MPPQQNLEVSAWARSFSKSKRRRVSWRSRAHSSDGAPLHLRCNSKKALQKHLIGSTATPPKKSWIVFAPKPGRDFVQIARWLDPRTLGRPVSAPNAFNQFFRLPPTPQTASADRSTLLIGRMIASDGD